VRIKVRLRIATACLAALVLACPGPSGAEETAAPAASTLDEVRALQEEGKYKRSLPLLDEILRDAPDSRGALGLRAVAHAELRRQMEALDDFQRFLELGPSTNEFLTVASVIVSAFRPGRPIPDLVGPPGKVTTPVLLHREPPDVSPSVHHACRGSRLFLDAVIQSNGRVKSVEVLRARLTNNAKADILTAAVTEAVLKWRYVPATQDGKPIETHFTVIFDFEVEGG